MIKIRYKNNYHLFFIKYLINGHEIRNFFLLHVILNPNIFLLLLDFKLDFL